MVYCLSSMVPKNMTTYFPSSYEESRERFKLSLSLLQSKWPDAHLETHLLTDHPDLSIDWLWAEPHANENLVILSTAEHGIEGYVGSAMLKIFIEEFAPRLNSENTGLLLIHAINPWGMKHHYRVNPNNVDLNRNFVFYELFDQAANPAYDPLMTLLNPQRPVRNLWLENILFLAKTVKGLISPGQEKIKLATLVGQYRFAKGVYYGGQKIQAETQVVMDLYHQALERYENIVQVDMHTGYGPRYQMTVLISPIDPTSSSEAMTKFDYPLVQKINADEFYNINGDMNDYFYLLRDAEFTEKKLFAGGFEFGTFGDSLFALIRSLRITILENQLRQFGAKNETIAQAVCKEYEELFFPDEAGWREKALADGRQAIQGILRAYQLI
jgi:hypothetical protein